MNNKFKIKGDITEIYVESPKYGRKKIVIDTKNLSLVSQYSWHLKKDGRNFYAHCSFPSVLMHRLITKFPENMVVDHINHNGLCNTEENLRVCTRLENGRNKINSKTKGLNYA